MADEHHITQGQKSIYAEQGDITVNYSGKKIPKNLTKPPFKSDVFIGREDDIRVVHDKLFNNSQLLLLVNGQGGIGKTTLAAHYYHTFQNDYQHLAWVFTGSSLLDALLTLAHPLQLEFPQELSAQQRLDGLLAKMAELEKPCLLVIDNANNLEDLENNYQALHSCANFHIVLTTRIIEFEQAANHKIGSLEPADAITLFQKHYPQHQADEESLLEKILNAVGYNTLVIELLAKNLNQFNNPLKTRYALADLLKDLQHKGMLALNTQIVSTSYHTKGSALRKETPEAIIAAMYDLGKLSDAETALLSIFAVLPAEDITYSILETLFPDIENLDTLLLALAQKGWLDNETTESFKVSPVVQQITRQKNQQHLYEDCLSLIEKLIEKLEYEPGTGHFLNASYQQAAQYTRYAESIVQHISASTDNLAILCERLGNYYNTTGNLDKALGFFEERARLGQELYQDYPTNVSFKNGLAISYSKLGETHSSLGNLDKALGFFEDETDLFKELYQDYPTNVSFKNGLAISYSKLGETHSSLGNLDKALGFFEERARLGQELYQDYPTNVSFKNGLAISYEKLGSTHSSLGNLDKALGFFEERARLGQELYQDYPTNVSFKNGLALSYQWLGVTYEKVENQSQAKEYYLLSKELLTALAESFPQYVEFKNNLDWVVDKLAEDPQ